MSITLDGFLSSLSSIKSNIKNSIESKGQVLTDVPFDQYASAISNIQDSSLNTDCNSLHVCKVKSYINDNFYSITISGFENPYSYLNGTYICDSIDKSMRERIYLNSDNNDYKLAPYAEFDSTDENILTYITNKQFYDIYPMSGGSYIYPVPKSFPYNIKGFLFIGVQFDNYLYTLDYDLFNCTNYDNFNWNTYFSGKSFDVHTFLPYLVGNILFKFNSECSLIVNDAIGYSSSSLVFGLDISLSSDNSDISAISNSLYYRNENSLVQRIPNKILLCGFNNFLNANGVYIQEDSTYYKNSNDYYFYYVYHETAGGFVISTLKTTDMTSVAAYYLINTPTLPNNQNVTFSNEDGILEQVYICQYTI